MKRLYAVLFLILSLALDSRGQGLDRSSYVRIKSCVEAKDSPGSGTRLSGPLPIYPWSLARAGISGEAAVRVVVGKDGVIQDVAVTEARVKELG